MQPPLDAGRLIDEGRWGGYQRWLVFLTALTIIFDGIDNQLLGIALPAILAEWGVARADLAPVVAVGFLGMMIGGAAAGLAGDRFGRRDALLASVGLFGLATMAVSAAEGVRSLALLRLVAGVGLGGALPNAAALAAEYVPAARRPIAVTVTIVCVPVGGALAGLFAIPLLPALGWRGLFGLGGGVPFVAAVALAWLLPESPRYLARHPGRWPELRGVLRRMGHTVPDDAAFADGAAIAGDAGPSASRVPARAILARGWRSDTLALWTAFASCLFAVYLGFSWLPTILTGAGLGSSVASAAISLFNLGGVAGALAGGWLITRYGSRPTMLAMAAGAVAGAAVLSAVPVTAPMVVRILVLLTLTGGLINAVQTTMYALAAHVYPTAMRATGVGAAVAIGRVGAILSGYAGPWALELRGSTSYFLVMAGALVVTCVSLAKVGRHVEKG